MRQNPSISTNEIAKTIGISQRKVFENIRILKDKRKLYGKETQNQGIGGFWINSYRKACRPQYLRKQQAFHNQLTLSIFSHPDSG